ncbi:hypothetical protein HYE54_01315, partial [Aggregatibacter actinomycetemcomitans]|nr:hypothetical protein [Aggregatibacter actinomycetemcomitans]MBN6086980.1 hypothetical protein [Aggregatibacter actinomycetemcomitans]
MTEPQLWVGYYQLTYLTQPQSLYFGHLIGFARNRDDFQQKIEHYKTTHQCKLVSQLAPLAARIGNRFYTFCLDALPENTQPGAVSF